jgi:hypothetical protein
MVSDGGTFRVPVTINGQLTLKFVIDSGASDVSIPADVVLTLVRTETISDADFLGKETYRLADGSTVPSQRFAIRSLKVGDKTLENVVATIAPVTGGLLLGQSFLSGFSSWSIDNQRQVLILRSKQPSSTIAERLEEPSPTRAEPPVSASNPKADQSAAQGEALVSPAAESQNPPAPPAAPAPSAGRAAMLVASADNPEKPVVSLGSTVWSLIPAAPGQPATVAAKAEADIPDLKMHAIMTLKKNTDPTLRATHTIDLEFSFAEGAPITGFKDVGLPQMRMEDSTAAEALSRSRSATPISSLP